MNREQEFNSISESIKSFIKYQTENCLLGEGDSLELIKLFPDNSISMILTDPPYHTTKKKNIFNDTAFEEDEHYLTWISLYAKEWKRILKPNGSIFLFCASQMASKIEILFSNEFNILSQIVWTKPNEPGFDGWKQKMKKEALRQWYAHSERIIFAEPACEGNLHRSFFANFLREKRKQADITAHKLAEMTGAYGKINHGGSVSNWETGRNIPSREQYSKICSALLSTGKIDDMPVYEDVIRPFQVDASIEFTDIWNFPSVRPYQGKHPAEKPLSMLKHAIEATTFVNDIVLDCFSGSGSTAIASFLSNRKSISLEIDSKWVSSTKSKLISLKNDQNINLTSNRITIPQHDQLQLFVANN